ncbi:MAG: TetR/AcrR family transcriptional regulator [Marinosulfonomonas sp.]|nr:TetR/AcrR family transcriptional regulator [Marinosulfonomonas sp.]
MNKRKTSSDRKAEILTATLDLAFEVGPDHVTTGMIAGRLGLTQPAIYKHFPKKQDVWSAVSETLCARISENAQKNSQADQNPMDMLRQLVLGHLQMIAEVPALPEIMVTRDPSGALSEARRRIQAAMNGFRAALTLDFENARMAGLFRAGLRTDDSVVLLFGVIQSLVLRLIVTRDPASLVRDGQRLLDLQLSLFAGKGDVG